jgi:hypothetical protein
MSTIRRFSSWSAGLALAAICIASFSFMWYAARTDSAIDDELAHIPAGYGYVHNLDYRLNPEHPPLVKALAMLPVLFLNPVFPTNTAAWQSEVNGEWDMGRQFLYGSGNPANEIIRVARIMPILLTILTIILVYFLARRIMGSLWALLPAFLFGMDPAIIANGHYVTTDVGAAFGFLLGIYFFVQLIESPTTKNLWLAGIAFGIAQLTKFSTPLLMPLFLLVLLALWVRDLSLLPRREALRTGWNYLKKVIFILLIGYLVVVYPIYFLFTLHYPIAKQTSDTIAMLGSFAGGPTPASQICHGARCLADADIWMTKSPVLRPFAEYLLGILMVLQRVDSVNTIYFLGHVVGSGGWIYFPVLFLLKEPIPTLIIVLLALFLAISWMWQRARSSRGRILKNISDYITVHPAEFTMGSFVAIYWAYSMHTTLNIGIRHVIATFPFIFILAAGVWRKWIMRFDLSRATTALGAAGAMMRSVALSLVKYIFLVALLVWLFLETLFTTPYFLSYFNEFAGGTMNGYHYVTDSNYDWGQDLLRLKAWVAAHPEVHTIAVDYFGGGDPSYELGAKEVNWWSAKGDPANQGIHWLAVSVNTLELATRPLADGQTRNASDSYAWLTAIRPPAPGMGNVPPPDFRIGTSIFVYHLP